MRRFFCQYWRWLSVNCMSHLLPLKTPCLHVSSRHRRHRLPIGTSGWLSSLTGLRACPASGTSNPQACEPGLAFELRRHLGLEALQVADDARASSGAGGPAAPGPAGTSRRGSWAAAWCCAPGPSPPRRGGPGGSAPGPGRTRRGRACRPSTARRKAASASSSRSALSSRKARLNQSAGAALRVRGHQRLRIGAAPAGRPGRAGGTAGQRVGVVGPALQHAVEQRSAALPAADQQPGRDLRPIAQGSPCRWGFIDMPALRSRDRCCTLAMRG
jgi:hypothetical protein